MSFTRFARATPQKPAFIFADDGEALSFAELDAASMQLARALRRSLEPGDRVAFLMDNGAAYYIAAWAARRSGLHYVPVNWHLGEDEAVYIAENSDARALIASPRLAGLAQAISARAPGVELRISDAEAFGDFRALAEVLGAEPAAPLEPELEGSYMFYSSGTTGQPKGILRPLSGAHFGEPSNLEGLMAGLFSFDENSVFLCPAPLYHAAPLGWTMGAQALGGTSVVPAKFDAEATLAQIERYRITHAQFVPTHFVRMLQLPEATRARYDLSSLKMVVHSAAPCPVEVKEKMMAWWGPVIHEYYSQSEGAGFTYVDPRTWLERRGTVGRPVSGRMLIVDDEGNELPAGETGHILVEGAARFEYHKAPGKTAEFFDAQGRSRPGDMGWMDADGFLYLTDRASHMIISGGVNIYPQEIESVLTLHPAVDDVAVVGVPNAEFGEEVKAVVKLKPGQEPSRELGRSLIAYCRERLAGFKCPRSVDFVEDLPRLPTGKLLKREIRKRYWPDGRTL